MSEATSLPGADDAAPGTLAALAELVAQAVQATPGVVRLEPSMKNSLNRLMAKGPAKTAHTGMSSAGVDGIVLNVRNGLTTAVVDIATHTDHTAADVADAVQRTVHELIAHHGRQPGPISVSVLSVE